MAQARRLGSERLRVVLGEVPAIAHAPHHEEAPLEGLHGKLVGREDVPDDVRAAQVGVLPVARVVGQRELATGVVPDLQNRLELALERVGRRRIPEDLRYRPLAAPDVELAAHRLHVVGQVGAAREQPEAGGSEKRPPLPRKGVTRDS